MYGLEYENVIGNVLTNVDSKTHPEKDSSRKEKCLRKNRRRKATALEHVQKRPDQAQLYTLHKTGHPRTPPSYTLQANVDASSTTSRLLLHSLLATLAHCPLHRPRNTPSRIMQQNVHTLERPLRSTEVAGDVFQNAFATLEYTAHHHNNIASYSARQHT